MFLHPKATLAQLAAAVNRANVPTPRRSRQARTDGTSLVERAVRDSLRRAPRSRSGLVDRVDVGFVSRPLSDDIVSMLAPEVI